MILLCVHKIYSKTRTCRNRERTVDHFRSLFFVQAATPAFSHPDRGGLGQLARRGVQDLDETDSSAFQCF